MSRIVQMVRASISWRMRRLKFAALHEWLRSPPYSFRYAGYDLLYNRGNALAMRYCIDGAYEPAVENYLQSMLKPDSVVIDAGANIGFFTLTVLSKSKGATIYGFEPSPDSYAIYEACILRNNLRSRVFANQVALYSEAGEMGFQAHASNYGAYDGFRETGYEGVGGSKTIKVPVTTLDLYAESINLKRLDLLKLDVEGAELYALRGARSVLSRLKPAVLFEVGYQNLRPFGILPSDVYKFLEESGYQILSLNQKPLTEVEFAHACIDEHEFVGLPKSRLATE
jgi:FkbM family methyltransferase